MIATAIALQNAAQESVNDPMIIDMARDLVNSRDLPDDEFIGKIYMYSAMLSSLTTTLATSAIMTEGELNNLMETIREMESMGKDLDNGNE